MKSIRVEKQGGPEVLKLAAIEAPGPGQAVVRIAAAGGMGGCWCGGQSTSVRR
jgi:NADPH:quinone reductase-like Zn-dependent oxidoreductase